MSIQRPALLVRLQPITPWRCGAGAEGEAAGLVASDSLFGAISDAMRLLGWLEEWLAEGAAAVRLSSLLPSQGDVYFAPLPEAVRNLELGKKLRLKPVRFAPLPAISTLATGRFDENHWVLDLASNCLLAADRAHLGGPYRSRTRNRAAVDRFTGSAVSAASAGACEFAAQGGLWALLSFSSEDTAAVWRDRTMAAFRVLADEGIGGWRNAGWGRSRRPRFRTGTLGELLSAVGWPVTEESVGEQWWTLGLFAPGEADTVRWTEGAYRTVERSGWAADRAKSRKRFVREGSVLSSPAEPGGEIARETVEGVPHPVLRYGAGLLLPWRKESCG